MLEGKEISGKIGEYGEYYADINAKGMVEVGVLLRVDLVAEAKKLAAKTSTPIDDAAIAWLEGMQKALGAG
jgi:hypothetical protein